MTEILDHFFDAYERVFPSWFLDVFVAVVLLAFVSWVVAFLV